MTNNKNDSLEEKLNGFLTKKAKIISICLCVAVAAALALAFLISSSNKSTEKDLAFIQNIEANLKMTEDKPADTSDEKTAEENKAEEVKSFSADEALSQLEPYTAKSGVTGVRANMLAAEIHYAKKSFDKAAESWVKAAEADKSPYTAPLCYFNAASAYESIETPDTQKACENYSKAAEYEEFEMIDRALFNAGRTNEQLGKTEEAKAFYEKLAEKDNAASWANLAKSRLIALEINK